MGFAPGDHVLVESLGKGVVREVRRGNRYLVEIKGRSLLVTDQQLSRIDEPRKKHASNSTADSSSVMQPAMRSHGAASLDLHGMTTDEAVSALDRFLNDAILAGLPEVRVIHGRSGGRVKAAVHGRLKAIPSVRGYRLDSHNPGVTIVTL